MQLKLSIFGKLLARLNRIEWAINKSKIASVSVDVYNKQTLVQIKMVNIKEFKYKSSTDPMYHTINSKRLSSVW